MTLGPTEWIGEEGVIRRVKTSCGGTLGQVVWRLLGNKADRGCGGDFVVVVGRCGGRIMCRDNGLGLGWVRIKCREIE